MAGIPIVDAGTAILYNAPAHSTRLFAIKRPSFAKGEFPEHLKQFSGQISNAPTACKGKRGTSYRECLIRESAHARK